MKKQLVIRCKYETQPGKMGIKSFIQMMQVVCERVIAPIREAFYSTSLAEHIVLLDPVLELSADNSPYKMEDQETLARVGFFYLQYVVKGGSVADASVLDPLVAKYFNVNLSAVLAGHNWKSPEVQIKKDP